MQTPPDAPDPRDVSPRWPVLVGAIAAFGLLTAFAASPRTALFWYIFPLFGIGATYLVQFRRELPARWIVTFAGTAVLSAVALGADWPFSGHILWNVLFLGHAWTHGRRWGAWSVVLLASLAHLVVLKAVSQTGRDLAGAGISVAVAAAVLAVLHRVGSRRATPGSPGA
jgi:hypothetical protein